MFGTFFALLAVFFYRRTNIFILEKLHRVLILYMQMLVYEFMSHGTLRDHLSGKLITVIFSLCLSFLLHLNAT